MRRFSSLLLAAILLVFSGSLFPGSVATLTRQPSSAPLDAVPLDRPLRFETLTLADGLSQNSVLAILQDRQGYLWVGTQDGLDRYDGDTFHSFKHIAQNPDSLSSSSILTLFEDSAGLIWVGTWGGGLDSYDSRTGKFTTYLNDPNNPSSLSHDIVTSITEDRQGRLWVGTCGGGLNFFDRETGKFQAYRHNPSDPSSLSNDAVSRVFLDSSGDLWVGTGCLGNLGDGLDRFQLAGASSSAPTGSSTHFRSIPGNPSSLSSNNISSIVQDASGMLWIGTGGYSLQGSGVDRLNPQTGKIDCFMHDASNAVSLSSNDVMALMVDSGGVLWIGTWGGGVDLLNTNRLAAGFSPEFSHQRSDPYNNQSLSSNLVWSFFEDRSGIFWIGTANGGIDKVNPQVQYFSVFRNSPTDSTSLIYNAVGPVLQDRQGRIWVATLGGGLELFNRSSETFTHFVENASDPFSQQANTGLALFEDASGSIWIGTLAGLGCFNPASGQTIYYRHDETDPNSIVNDTVSSIAQDLSGRIWVGTLGGLDYLDSNSGHFIHVQVPGLESVLKLTVDQRNTLWIGSWGQGLFQLDLWTLSRNTITSVRYANDPSNPASLADDDVVDLLFGRTGTYWIGTQGGLDRFDPDSGTFTHVQTQNGLPDSSINCILEDNQGHLWISTNGGISDFDPTTSTFRNFDVSDGLQSNEFDSGACGKTLQGEMYFGGQEGLNVFDPAAIQDNLVAPLVAVTSFSIQNKPVDVDLSGAEPIQLSYMDNFIAFDFVALDFHAPQKNQYAYQMVGFDKDWIQAGAKRSATYTNLPGGQYTFKVKASNNNGVWNDTGVSIPVSITPPLWQNWWFQGASLLALLAIGFMGARWRIESVNSQNRHLEELVQQRTFDLKQSNEQLLLAIDQRQKAEAALAEKAAGEAVIAERTRLARDLHDAVTQTLFSASLIAEVVPQIWDRNQEEARRRLDELRELTRGALAEMRTLLLELRPSSLTDTSLPDLLRQLVEAVTGRARLPVQLSVEGDCPFPPDVQVACYRIAQEALNNIVKYAHATQVVVSLRLQCDSIRLAIMDDGIGFDVASVPPNHLGLEIMRERAEAIGAQLKIYSEPGDGTQITVTWSRPEQDVSENSSGTTP